MKHLVSIGVVFLLAATGSVSAMADEAAAYRTLLEERGGSIVTIKAVLRSEISMMGQTQDEESRSEVSGVVINDRGLILASNSAFSAGRVMQMMGMNMPGLSIDITPVDLKIVFDGDEKEYEAFMVASDADLDLAFLQIVDLEGRAVKPIDFDGSVQVETGDRLLSVNRLGRGFDYAPHVETARVGGAIRRPRRAWIVDGSVSGLGLPVFTVDGRVVGVLSTIASGTVDDAGEGMMGMMAMFSGGGGGPVAVFALPGRSIRSAISAASDRASQMLEERRAETGADE